MSAPLPFRRRPWRRVLLAACVMAGCYGYVPLDRPAAEGAQVQVHLTNDVAPEVERVLGRGTAAVEGRVLAAGDTGVVLAVSRSVRRDSSEATWGGEQVTIPRGAIDRLSERRLNRRRSATFAGIVVATIAAIMAVVANARGDASSSGTGGGGGAPPT